MLGTITITVAVLASHLTVTSIKGIMTMPNVRTKIVIDPSESFCFPHTSDFHSWQSDPKGFILLTIGLLLTFNFHVFIPSSCLSSITTHYRFKFIKIITNLEPIKMTATTEWAQVESSMESIAPPSSDDLFDGDILGDELMDIYNAAVVGGGSDDDEVMNGM